MEMAGLILDDNFLTLFFYEKIAEWLDGVICDIQEQKMTREEILEEFEKILVNTQQEAAVCRAKEILK